MFTWRISFFFDPYFDCCATRRPLSFFLFLFLFLIKVKTHFFSMLLDKTLHLWTMVTIDCEVIRGKLIKVGNTNSADSRKLQPIFVGLLFCCPLLYLVQASSVLRCFSIFSESSSEFLAGCCLCLLPILESLMNSTGSRPSENNVVSFLINRLESCL